MGDFFYYGQKNVIRRLNELAGRGAVVASYAPKVGMSPLGGPNGYMDPKWLDPSIPIVTTWPLGVHTTNKFGYSFLQGGQGQRLYKIATMAATGGSTFASLRIDAVLGGWGAATLTAMTIVIGSRVDDGGGVSVDWSSSRWIPSDSRFLAYQETDGRISVYLFFAAGSFAQAAFNMLGLQTVTYATPAEVSSASGTLVWNSAALPSTAGYASPRSCGMGAQAGASTGTSFDTVVEVRSADARATVATSALYGAWKENSMTASSSASVLCMGISANAGVSYAGCFNWFTSVGAAGSPFTQGYKLTLNALDLGSNNLTAPLFSVTGTGAVYIPALKAGSSDTSLRHHISRGTAQSEEILYIGIDGATAPSVGVLASDGTFSWAAPTSVLYVGKNSVTGRSIAAGGTITGQGSDMAEYFWKCPSCASVTAGQIIGINNKNQVTDVWADAVMFAIKSTDPSFVGGDTWSKDIGPRPSAKAGAEPVKPVRISDEMGEESVPGSNPTEHIEVGLKRGDTDEEWAAKMADYNAAIASWHAAVIQDNANMDVFDAALEVERQKVDRIAIAGRVPVNVLGAQPGDYIVPVQDGAGIKGIAIRQADLSHLQYLQAVGRVISIEPDGRAYVMVKVV